MRPEPQQIDAEWEREVRRAQEAEEGKKQVTGRNSGKVTLIGASIPILALVFAYLYPQQLGPIFTSVLFAGGVISTVTLLLYALSDSVSTALKELALSFALGLLIVLFVTLLKPV